MKHKTIHSNESALSWKRIIRLAMAILVGFVSVLTLITPAPAQSLTSQTRSSHYDSKKHYNLKQAQKFEEASFQKLMKQKNNSKTKKYLPSTHHLSRKHNLKHQLLLLLMISQQVININNTMTANSHSLNYQSVKTTKHHCQNDSLITSESKVEQQEVKKDVSRQGPPQAGNFWAQEMIKSDLMKNRVREILKQKQNQFPIVPVAVVDSGYYEGYEDYLYKNVTFLKKDFRLKFLENDVAISSNQPPSFLDTPHGTSVTSLIAGEGLGTAAEGIALTSYRFSYLPSTKLFKALTMVCDQNRDPQGLTIINLSMTLLADESPTKIKTTGPAAYTLTRDELMYPSELKEMAEKGCLIVKASSNNGYRGENVNDPDDALLRVESVGPTGKLSSFSSIGEVAAPGEGVWTIDASRKGLLFRKIKILLSNIFDVNTPFWDSQLGSHCLGDSGELSSLYYCNQISGTSFAAPLVTGVISQVVRVLKTEPFFRQLSPINRILLVNRILKNSQGDRGSINGDEAVRIAEEWALISQAKGHPLDPHFADSI